MKSECANSFVIGLSVWASLDYVCFWRKTFAPYENWEPNFTLSSMGFCILYTYTHASRIYMDRTGGINIKRSHERDRERTGNFLSNAHTHRQHTHTCIYARTNIDSQFCSLSLPHFVTVCLNRGEYKTLNAYERRNSQENDCVTRKVENVNRMKAIGGMKSKNINDSINIFTRIQCAFDCVGLCVRDPVPFPSFIFFLCVYVFRSVYMYNLRGCVHICECAQINMYWNFKHWHCSRSTYFDWICVVVWPYRWKMGEDGKNFSLRIFHTWKKHCEWIVFMIELEAFYAVLFDARKIRNVCHFGIVSLIFATKKKMNWNANIEKRTAQTHLSCIR